jgi:dedicator of cytokinesis protein 3
MDRAEAIAISLRVLNGVASHLIREYPSILVDTPITSRLTFPDVTYPGTFRNDVYLRLGSAYFSPSPASSGGSIRGRKPAIPINTGDVQITVEIKRNEGTVIPDVIYAGGSGEPSVSQYQSLVYHHNDRPNFGDLVKISIPSRVTDCHVFFTFRSRSKDRSPYSDQMEQERPFAFAYLPLLGSTCIKDGNHQLVLYRSEKGTPASPNVYLDAPAFGSQSTIALHPNVQKNITQLRDRLTVKTTFCSNLHTQDDTLRALFRWQGLLGNPEDLANMLQMFGFVSENEIAKFVPPVFDSLFGILASSIGERQEDIDELVFQSLARVSSMVTDRRFPNFKPVLDIYIDQHFNHPSASSRLLRSMIGRGG